MDFIKAAKRATGIVNVGLCALLLLSGKVLGQTTIYFDYKNPRNGKPETASNYLSDFASRSRVRDVRCYEMGWYKFHVRQTAVSDSVAFYGDIHPELRALGEKSIRESQIYWRCNDCEKTGGHWFTIPVLLVFTCVGNCAPNAIFDQSSAFWNELFRSHKSQQIPVSPTEWLLAPMSVSCMR